MTVHQGRSLSHRTLDLFSFTPRIGHRAKTFHKRIIIMHTKYSWIKNSSRTGIVLLEQFSFQQGYISFCISNSASVKRFFHQAVPARLLVPPKFLCICRLPLRRMCVIISFVISYNPHPPKPTHLEKTQITRGPGKSLPVIQPVPVPDPPTVIGSLYKMLCAEAVSMRLDSDIRIFF